MLPPDPCRYDVWRGAETGRNRPSSDTVHIFLAIVFALLALNLIGFIFTICGFDLGWPFLLGSQEASHRDERLGRRR
jgi:hypothetical protein